MPLKQPFGTSGEVQTLEPRVTLEVCDLDDCTDVTEVREALSREFPDLGDREQVTVTGPNKQGLKLSILKLCGSIVGCGLGPKYGAVICVWASDTGPRSAKGPICTTFVTRAEKRGTSPVNVKRLPLERREITFWALEPAGPSEMLWIRQTSKRNESASGQHAPELGSQRFT